jgi:hypothetical protein
MKKSGHFRSGLSIPFARQEGESEFEFEFEFVPGFQSSLSDVDAD